MAANPLLTRLKIFADLSAADEALLDQLCTNVRETAADRDIVRDGSRPEHIHLILEGWAARYEIVPNGARQFTAFLLPGDFCDLHVTVLGKLDHGIVALTRCKVCYIDPAAMDRATSESIGLTRALWWSTLVDSAVLRSWVVNVGRRDAYARVAHLLCELHARAEMAGLINDDELSMPLTQSEIADATGLTPVHVNRTIQRLRKDGLIEMEIGQLRLLDAGALRKAAGFDPAYLHITRRVRA